jgi:hypothetical protein
MADQSAGTVLEDAVAALRSGFSREKMLGRPEKFTEESQFRMLEQSLGMDTVASPHPGGLMTSPPPASLAHPARARAPSSSAAATYAGAGGGDDAPAGAAGTGAGAHAHHHHHHSHHSGSSHAAAAGGAGDAPASSAEPEEGEEAPPSPGSGIPPGVTTVPPLKRVEDLTVQQIIWQTMDDPSSSRAAQLVAGVVMVVILVSCTAFVLQTLPEYVQSTDNVWNLIEDICITVFTVEFVLRISTCPSRWHFVRQPLNMIDFLAILPFYLELILGTAAGGSAVIRIIRLVRIFRIFKLSRYLPWVRVFTNALALSLQPLLMLVLVVLIAMVLFSSVIYYAERGEWSDDERAFMRTHPLTGDVTLSPYQSIPESFWWCIVTMTTGP